MFISNQKIVTTPSNRSMSAIHHRLPLILEKNQWSFWLGEKGHGASALMTPTDDKTLTAYKVSPAINSNKSLGPELITPI